MKIKPIRSDADCDEALADIERLFDVDEGTPEADTLEVLVTLVEAYEAKHYPIDPPDPISALEHYLDRKGLARKDLKPYIGTIGRVHEIMNRRRRLTLDMIRKLSPVTGIPISTLAQAYELLPYDSRHSTQSKAKPRNKTPAGISLTSSQATPAH